MTDRLPSDSVVSLLERLGIVGTVLAPSVILLLVFILLGVKNILINFISQNQ